VTIVAAASTNTPAKKIKRLAVITPPLLEAFAAGAEVWHFTRSVAKNPER
jgi:hypothetical protein